VRAACWGANGEEQVFAFSFCCDGTPKLRRRNNPFRLSGFRLSGFWLLASGFWLSGFLAFWLSGFLAFWLSGFRLELQAGTSGSN
jgi:hypothetical protein